MADPSYSMYGILFLRSKIRAPCTGRHSLHHALHGTATAARQGVASCPSRDRDFCCREGKGRHVVRQKMMLTAGLKFIRLSITKTKHIARKNNSPRARRLVSLFFRTETVWVEAEGGNRSKLSHKNCKQGALCCSEVSFWWI